MSSENKKRKEKNSNSNHGFALKEKIMKLKRALYFNASKRKELKKIKDWEQFIKKKMEKFEYNVVIFQTGSPELQRDILNSYGDKGWNLVSVCNGVAYFKRLKN